MNEIGDMTSSLEGFSQSSLDSIIKGLATEDGIKKTVLMMALIINSSRKVEGFDNVIKHIANQGAFGTIGKLGSRSGVSDGFNATAVRTVAIAVVYNLMSGSVSKPATKDLLAAAYTKWNTNSNGDAPKIRMEVQAKFDFSSAVIVAACKIIATKL